MGALQVDGRTSLSAAALRRLHADEAALIAASCGGTARAPPGIRTYDPSTPDVPDHPGPQGGHRAVDNPGTTVPNAYVWFAARTGNTTFHHSAGGDSRNAGKAWRPSPQPGYEVLPEVELQPS